MVVAAACPTDDTLSQGIGRRLRMLREERGIRRERVALALEMGAENFRNYESGRSRLPLDMLPVIADVLGMSAQGLAGHLLGDDIAAERSA